MSMIEAVRPYSSATEVVTQALPFNSLPADGAPDLPVSPRTLRIPLVEALVATEEWVQNGALQTRSPATLVEELSGDNATVRTRYCFSTNEPGIVKSAQRMVAQEYLKRGFVSLDQIDSEGKIAAKFDPWAQHSTYYVLRDAQSGSLVATTRKIHYSPEAGAMSFPLWEHRDKLEPEYVTYIEGVGLDKCTEVSALVKNKALDGDNQATLALYRKLFQDAWSEDVSGTEEVWLMECNPKLYESLKLYFDGSIQRIGHDLPLQGQEAIPAMFHCRQGTIDLIRKASDPNNANAEVHRAVINFMFDGIDTEALAPEILNALRESHFDDILTRLGVG